MPQQLLGQMACCSSAGVETEMECQWETLMGWLAIEMAAGNGRLLQVPRFYDLA